MISSPTLLSGALEPQPLNCNSKVTFARLHPQLCEKETCGYLARSAPKLLSRLIAWVDPIQDPAHERDGTQHRNLQPFW